MHSLPGLALINAIVRPMDPACSQAEALLIRGDRIHGVGSTKDIVAAAGSDATIIDMQGHAIFPGFIDTHSHLSIYAALSEHVYCGAEVETLEGALARLRKRATELGPGQAIVGWGFDDTILPEGRGPTLEELDAIASDRPVVVLHISLHACYVNSFALHQAGLDTETQIPGGEVVRDEEGKPTGLLLEGAVYPVRSLAATPDPDHFPTALRKAIADYNAAGFTATHEAGVGLGMEAEAYVRCLYDMEQQGDLNIRTYLSFLPEAFAPYAQAIPGPGFGSPHIIISGPKLVFDGSIQAYTAALTNPYHDRPDHCSGLLETPENMNRLVDEYHGAGWQIAWHGNGDACIEAMITAVEEAQRRTPRPDPRHILVHCQTASEDQLKRMKAAGIVPSFFGLHVWYYGDRHYERFLGPERANRMNPSGSAVRLGLPHSLHADTPVFPQWTIRSIHTAVNRTTRNGRVLGEDQRISAEEAIRAYTTHAAWFQFAEKDRGSLEVGKLADLVVLSQDPLAVAPENIIQTQILTTITGGRVVYGSFPA